MARMTQQGACAPGSGQGCASREAPLISPRAGPCRVSLSPAHAESPALRRRQARHSAPPLPPLLSRRPALRAASPAVLRTRVDVARDVTSRVACAQPPPPAIRLRRLRTSPPPVPPPPSSPPLLFPAERRRVLHWGGGRWGGAGCVVCWQGVSAAGAGRRHAPQVGPPRQVPPPLGPARARSGPVGPSASDPLLPPSAGGGFAGRGAAAERGRRFEFKLS